MTPRGRLLLAVVIVAAIASAAAVTAYAVSSGQPVTKPTESFLIVANINGFNDSVDHGVPQNPWPVIHVAKGTTVSITVYNDDTQAHGFQVTHYFDSSIETIAPGQKVTITFVADLAGTFRMYCSIFCTAHAFMQSGELVVG